VVDDKAAIMECARVLRPGGVAVFTIPGDYEKQKTVVFSKPDGNGHYRHYGLDVLDLLRQSFSSVEAVDMHGLAPASARVRPRDTVFICHS
jgi:SAM-dependent methyltransferase